MLIAKQQYFLEKKNEVLQFMEPEFLSNNYCQMIIQLYLKEKKR